MRDRYNVNRQKWHKFCTMDNCKKKYIRCNKCGYPGHKAFWLDTSKPKIVGDNIFFDVIVLIAHAHFVNDKDVGRHVTHVIGHKKILEKFCVKTYMIKPRKLPRHVLDMLNDEDDDDDNDGLEN